MEIRAYYVLKTILYEPETNGEVPYYIEATIDKERGIRKIDLCDNLVEAYKVTEKQAKKLLPEINNALEELYGFGLGSYCYLKGINSKGVKNETKANERLGTERIKLLADTIEENYDSLIFDERGKYIASETPKMTPKELVEELDKVVVGCTEAKKKISVAVYNLLKGGAIQYHTLLIGDSGVGKTLLAESVADIVGLPFINIDCSQYTSAGYKGADVNDIFKDIYEKTGENEVVPPTICLLDEIDKKRKNIPSQGDFDSIGEAFQNELLRAMNGDTIQINLDNPRMGLKETINVSFANVLFIFAGCFEGIEPIIKQRMTKGNGIGIGRNNVVVQEKDLKMQTTRDDLSVFGFKQEFLGRIPLIALLPPLKKEQLVSILALPKSPIAQVKMLLGEELDPNKEVDIEAIVNKALDSKMGGRKLNELVVEEFLEDIYNKKEF